MPTTYTDQFFVIDPGNPPANGTNLTVQMIDFIDTNDNGFIQPNTGDTAGGQQVTSVWVNDTITVTMNGSTVTITGVTFYRAGGEPAIFTPTDGTVLSDAVFQSSTYVTTSTQVSVGAFGPPCFTPGTMIETPDGLRPVEDLQPGDLVLTRDNGAQVLRWSGSRTLGGEGRFAPIRFAPGAIGNAEELLVSPQHRMLISGWQAELFFGVDEVLVPAKHLVNGDTIHVAARPQVTYIHLLFDRHEIVTAGGVASESYHIAHVLSSGEDATRAELAELFPDLDTEAETTPTARQVLKSHEGMLLAA